MLSFKYIPDAIFTAAHTSKYTIFTKSTALLDESPPQEVSADGTAASTARMGSLKANMTHRVKEGSANGTAALTARL